MHHRKGQSRVRTGPQKDHLIGKGAGLGAAHINDDHARPAPLGLFDMADGMGLTDGIGTPQDDHL